jgi:two-component system, sensor histidine kinase SagS
LKPRLRFLVLRASPQDGMPPLPPEAEIVEAGTLMQAQARLQQEHFDGFVVAPSAFPAVHCFSPVAEEIQSKLDALYRAGHDLAALEPAQLAQMDSEERVDYLKRNILRYARQLLHHDSVDIRLVQPNTGRLDPLVCEGMAPGVEKLELFARPTGNGVSGFVASTGQSYYCPDTQIDTLYIPGAKGAQSSHTVPIVDQNKVIGVLTIESLQRNGFTPQQQEYLEIFGQEIGAALHTLKMLSAERRGVAVQSVDMLRRELAVPMDEIINSATFVLDQYIGLEPEMAERLQTILQHARSIRTCYEKVGAAIAPPSEDLSHETPSPRFPDLRILVIDNDERVRRSAHVVLERFGCAVETAHDGWEALRMVRLSKYDVVLCDIRLPDMNGHEIFQKLRQLDPQLLVVLMSGYGYDAAHSIVKAKQDGLKAVLFKPFRTDQLLEVLENRTKLMPGKAEVCPAKEAVAVL